MPCYSVSTISIEFKAENFGVLANAVRSMGGTLSRNVQAGIATAVINGVTISIANGQATATARNASTLINELRVAYSKEVVSQATAWAKAKGWTLQNTGQNKLTLSKGK